jgi:PST family polysaccharide transporter
MSTSSKSIARIALRNTVWTLIGNNILQIIGFVSILILTRLLNPDIFGIFSLASFWSGLLSLRPKFALSYAAIRQPALDGKLLGTYAGLDLMIAGISMILTLACAAIMAYFQLYQSAVIKMILLASFAENVTAIVGALGMALEKEMQLSRSMLSAIISSFIGYASAIFLAWQGVGLWSLASINLINFGIGIIAVFIVSHNRLPQIFSLDWYYDKTLAINLLKTGVGIGIAMAIGGFVTQFDNFLIGTFVNTTTLGFYDRAFRIASWPLVLISVVISRVSYLTFSKMKDDSARLTFAVQLGLWVSFLLGVPITLVAFFGAVPIITLLYGQTYLPSVPYLQFLSISNFTWTIISIVFWLATALGNVKFNIRLNVVLAILLIGIGTPLTIYFYVDGTLISVGIMVFMGLVLSMYFLLTHIKLNVRNDFLMPILSAFITIVLLFTLERTVLLSFSQLINLLLITLVSFSTYWSCMMLFNRKAMLERFNYLRTTWHNR